MLRFFTAGESHGKMLIGFLEGLPSGIKITCEEINFELARRQRGYGRGKRMLIESDKVSILSGVRWGKTTGSPICVAIENRDWENNKKVMSIDEKDVNSSFLILHPRPGHADLPGYIKYMSDDLRDIQERASARETTARVAAGAICKKYLKIFGIKIYSFVEEICGIKMRYQEIKNIDEVYSRIENSPLRCPDTATEKKMMKVIDKMKEKGDTVGGKFCVIVQNIPPGLGSHIQWDLKLDARIAASILSIQAVKGVEFGKGFDFAKIPGSKAHDEIFYKKGKGYFRKTNNAGGIEGGISNGEDIVLHAVMKPIPTLGKPLASVNIKTKKESRAEVIRSDICAVPSCSIIAEAMVSIEIAKAIIEKFGGDSVNEILKRYNDYIKYITSI